MIGLILALLSGSSHCLSSILIRRGVYHSGESFTPIPISNFTGTVLFGLAILISGKAVQLTFLSWTGVGYLAAAGVLHFIIGRQLAYIGLRLIGANRSNPVITGNILVSALLGVFFLGEPLTVYLVLALFLIIVGTISISRTGGSEAGGEDISKGSLTKGLVATLGAALCWGVSPFLVKMGLHEVNSPVVATFISYTAAAIVAGILLIHPKNNEKLRRLDQKSLIPIGAGAVTTSIAHILRYTALAYSPVSLVAPLIVSINGLLVFPLSFLINKRIEAFNLRIILGAVVIIVGVLFIFRAA